VTTPVSQRFRAIFHQCALRRYSVLAGERKVTSNVMDGLPKTWMGRSLLAALHELAERLDPMRFVRIHRSAIINIESILQLEPISHGEFEVVLKSGLRSRISRTYRAQLEKRLGQSL
jgi:LytTr DNA-binding domain